MLVKNEKKYCDAHFHYAQTVLSQGEAVHNGILTLQGEQVQEGTSALQGELVQEGTSALQGELGQEGTSALQGELVHEGDFSWHGCSCFHFISEWESVSLPANVTPCFGLHPQSSGSINIKENADFLENLICQKKIKAVGEAGFDFYTEKFKDNASLQEEMFNIQLSFAIQYQLPLVVHCRKANEKIFEYAKELKKVPAVLFHSFMGTNIEAHSLIKRNLNCFFSFGKQIMNNNKKVIDCTKNLPLENLLLETDAPYQFLKGEKETRISDIQIIYKNAYSLRQEKISFEQFCNQLEMNYKKLLF